MKTIQLFAVSLILINEALCTTMLFPFVGLFVGSLMPSVDRSAAGYYSGLLIGAFQGAQAIVCSQWGRLSDRVGRKPVFLFGLMCGAVCVLLFGMSTSLPMAMVFRGLHGCFAANAPLAKTYVAEATDKNNQAAAFGMLSVTWAIGAFVGPMVGGFLYDPCEASNVLSGLCSKGSIFAEHPALLPCVAVSVYTVIAALMVEWYLPETNVKAISPLVWMNGVVSSWSGSRRRVFGVLPQGDEDGEEAEDGSSKPQAMLEIKPPLDRSRSSIVARRSSPTSNGADTVGVDVVSDNSSFVMQREFTEDMTGGVTTSVDVEERITDTSSYHNHTQSDDEEPQTKGRTLSSDHATTTSVEPAPAPLATFSWSDMFRHPVLQRCVPMYMTLCAYNIIFNETLPLYAIAFAKDGGLELTSTDVGTFFTINAALSIACNLGFARAAARYEKLFLWRFCSWMFAVSVVLYGVCTMLNDFHSKVLSIGFIGFLSIFRCCASTWSFSLSMMFVANAAPPDHLGRVTGMAHACGSLMRSLWPLIAAPIFAWSIATAKIFPFNHYCVFVISALLAVLGWYLSLFLREEDVIKKTSEPAAAPPPRDNKGAPSSASS